MRPRSALVGVLALIALLAFAPSASATYNPIAGGATKISLDKGLLALLKQHKAKLTAIAPAKLKGTTLTLPVGGGKLDPTTSKGSVEHEGGLRFSAGSKSVPLTALQLKTTQKHNPFSAKLGGGQLKFASASALAVSRKGFGVDVKTSKLKLTAKVAERLDKKLRLRGVFNQGLLIGSSLTRTTPATVALQGAGKASLTPNPETIAKLNALFVAVNPIFPAEHIGSVFTFPIFGGTIAPDASSGTMETNGTLELIQLSGGQVFLHEPWVDLGAKTLSAEVEVQPAPPYPGKQGRLPIADLGLAGAAISSNPGARTVTVNNATATMQAGLAETLNEVFARPKGKGNVFKSGEALGGLSFTAQAQ